MVILASPLWSKPNLGDESDYRACPRAKRVKSLWASVMLQSWRLVVSCDSVWTVALNGRFSTQISGSACWLTGLEKG